MQRRHDRSLQARLRRDQDAVHSRVVVDDVERPTAYGLIRAIEEQVLSRKLVTSPELACPAFRCERQRLVRPLRSLAPDDRDMVPPARQLAAEVVRHQLDAPITLRRNGKPGADDDGYPPRVHTGRTRPRWRHPHKWEIRGNLQSAATLNQSGTPRTISSPSASASTECSPSRSEEHTSELQSLAYLVCRLLLEKKNT